MVRPASLLLLAMLLLHLSIFAAQTEERRVSYGREIAPLFALYCHACHGSEEPSSSFQVTAYPRLMRGGLIGDDIVPGRPERSTLLQFIEGKRGEKQRMPQGSEPLSHGQIAMIRKWIRQGALNDHVESSCYDLNAGKLELIAGERLSISCKVPVEALLRLTLTDPVTRVVLHSTEGSLKAPPERANIGAPGQWVHWSIGKEREWPSHIEVSLRIQFATGSMDGTMLAVKGKRAEMRTSELKRLGCVPD